MRSSPGDGDPEATPTCETCGGKGLVSYSGRGSDGPDPCPGCGPQACTHDAGMDDGSVCGKPASTHVGLDIPRCARHAPGGHPVSPTRDQVRAAIHDAGLSNLASDAAADAVMALVESLSCPHVRGETTQWCSLAETKPQVLWEEETRPTFRGSGTSESYIAACIPVQPGTRVRVVAAEGETGG
jgi:hypothetical protein